MLITAFKSKIHRATITEANLQYEGSFTIDEDLMLAADIRPYEKVSIVNINNGERIETYVIKGKKGSGVMCLNGAAARRGAVGDKVIIITYGHYEQKELENHKPVIVQVDDQNRIIETSSAVESNRIVK